VVKSPLWEKWEQEKGEKRQAEMTEGRRRTTIAMMEGLVEQLCGDYGMKKESVHLDSSHPDIRHWTVQVELAPGGVVHTESFWEFPSEELKAMLMLTQKR
jgi:hypothetical protein